MPIHNYAQSFLARLLIITITSYQFLGASFDLPILYYENGQTKKFILCGVEYSDTALAIKKRIKEAMGFDVCLQSLYYPLGHGNDLFEENNLSFQDGQTVDELINNIDMKMEQEIGQESFFLKKPLLALEYYSPDECTLFVHLPNDAVLRLGGLEECDGRDVKDTIKQAFRYDLKQENLAMKGSQLQLTCLNTFQSRGKRFRNNDSLYDASKDDRTFHLVLNGSKSASVFLTHKMRKIEKHDRWCHEAWQKLVDMRESNNYDIKLFWDLIVTIKEIDVDFLSLLFKAKYYQILKGFKNLLDEMIFFLKKKGDDELTAKQINTIQSMIAPYHCFSDIEIDEVYIKSHESKTDEKQW